MLITRRQLRKIVQEVLRNETIEKRSCTNSKGEKGKYTLMTKKKGRKGKRRKLGCHKTKRDAIDQEFAISKTRDE